MYKMKFDASRLMEIDNLLKLNALSVISPKESDHVAKTTPENIIHHTNKHVGQVEAPG